MTRVCVRYHITPARELQFGAVTLNSHKTRTFTIENIASKFDFKFNITDMPLDAATEPSIATSSTKQTKDDKKK